MGWDHNIFGLVQAQGWSMKIELWWTVCCFFSGKRTGLFLEASKAELIMQEFASYISWKCDDSMLWCSSFICRLKLRMFSGVYGSSSVFGWFWKTHLIALASTFIYARTFPCQHVLMHASAGLYREKPRCLIAICHRGNPFQHIFLDGRVDEVLVSATGISKAVALPQKTCWDTRDTCRHVMHHCIYMSTYDIMGI